MRKLEQKMMTFLDSKLNKNGLAQHAIKEGDARTLFVEAAKACVGIREEGGNNKGPMVQLIQETIGSAGREAWCMAFVQTMLAYAEKKTGKSSPIWPSEHCLTTWRDTPKIQRVQRMPLPGAIAIWQYGNTSSGHTGVVLGCDEKEFTAVEGNTTSGSDDVNGPVIREGGGVYYTRRSRRGSGDMRVVGFIKPF